MREKLLDLLKNEGLKPSQLAEMLGINPAGISHILAGRNKPSFELLQKILRRFPRINPDWLLLDDSHMYRLEERKNESETNVSTATPSAPGKDLFSTSTTATTPKEREAEATEDRSGLSEMAELMAKPSGTSVARIIVLYNDHTFESFTPHPAPK